LQAREDLGREQAFELPPWPGEDLVRQAELLQHAAQRSGTDSRGEG